MRGLEEIVSRNETPNGFHGDSNEHEQFRPSQRTSKEGTTMTSEQALDFVSIMTKISGGELPSPKDRKEMFAVAKVYDLLGLTPPDDYDTAKVLAAMLAAKAIKMLDDMIGDKPKRTLADRSRLNDKGDRVSSEGERFLGMDGIHSAIDAKPDFLKFWQKLNDDRAAGGHGEALYKEAKLAFSGGETPVGALTFIGKEWEGLRAIPAKTFEGKKTYHGEFRSVAPEGNLIWNVVSNTNCAPIAYANAEAALNGARHARIHSEAQKS